jgi:DNA (cytosine-5)-methyltransferase 1
MAPQDMWDCVISFRPSGLRVKRMTHLPALVAITQTPVLGPLGRRLSIREAARLQGLPETFEFGAQRDALTFRQLGNGVNTGVVRNVLLAHARRDQTLLEATAIGRPLHQRLTALDSGHMPAQQAFAPGAERRGPRLAIRAV